MKYLPILLLLIACEKPSDGWMIYTIPAGQHKQAWHPIPHTGDKISFAFVVDSSWYQSSGGVNKVCGFSYGPHHDNSARLGFEMIDGQVYGFAYTYVEGVRFYEPFITLSPGEWFCTIEREGDQYRFQIGETVYYCPAAGWMPGVVCLPYIGGDGVFEREFVCRLNRLSLF